MRRLYPNSRRCADALLRPRARSRCDVSFPPSCPGLAVTCRGHARPSCRRFIARLAFMASTSAIAGRFDVSKHRNRLIRQVRDPIGRSRGSPRPPLVNAPAPSLDVAAAAPHSFIGQSAGRPPRRRPTFPEVAGGDGEESPGSMDIRCRITSGGGDPRDSATENRPPRRPYPRVGSGTR
jgi:hypothetical protein